MNHFLKVHYKNDPIGKVILLGGIHLKYSDTGSGIRFTNLKTGINNDLTFNGARRGGRGDSIIDVVSNGNSLVFRYTNILCICNQDLTILARYKVGLCKINLVRGRIYTTGDVKMIVDSDTTFAKNNSIHLGTITNVFPNYKIMQIDGNLKHYTESYHNIYNSIDTFSPSLLPREMQYSTEIIRKDDTLFIKYDSTSAVYFSLSKAIVLGTEKIPRCKFIHNLVASRENNGIKVYDPFKKKSELITNAIDISALHNGDIAVTFKEGDAILTAENKIPKMSKAYYDISVVTQK